MSQIKEFQLILIYVLHCNSLAPEIFEGFFFYFLFYFISSCYAFASTLYAGTKSWLQLTELVTFLIQLGCNYRYLGRVLQRESKQALSISLCLSRPIPPSCEILGRNKLLLSNVAPTLCSWIKVQDHYT